MQKNEFSTDFQTSNPFSEHFTKFGKTRLFDRLQTKFTPKPYYYQYRIMRAVALGASILFHILSAATAAALVFLFVGKLLPSDLAAGAVTLAALAALEFSKRETSGRFFHDALQFSKISPGLCAAVVGLSAISIACSYFGAEKAVKELTPPPVLMDADTLTAPLRAQIADIAGQITDAKKNTWKGKVTAPSQRTIERLTAQKETLLNELVRQQSRTDTRNDETEKTHTVTTEANASGFALFTLCSELLLILCLWYLQYYDFRSYAEYCAKPTGSKAASIGFRDIQTPVLSANGDENGTMPTNEAARRPIGFHPQEGNEMRYRARDNEKSCDASSPAAEVQEIDKSLKPCEHCGTLFRYRTTWQKFCSTDCKLAYHEAKHGRKFDPNYKRKPKPANT